MRLKQVKLAGFKSFVNPICIPFEQKMTAIVGPNGCGKSNIIDAVRWVLGESSAKNLRGDTMTDVIFNGAASRKPVGQASVELIFDNTQGRLKGSMADRNEVSIRRVVNRDSINSYYLNNAKCRRKDITDIFLGTGLGPRSYAIIEQGTITRLIESKPQDLRVFIEEAAGISKYKEKRRETETRIKHTRENLSRLADIRHELSLQLDKLHQQAEAAKRFRSLKADERKYKAELAVLRWQNFHNKSEALFSQLDKLDQSLKQQESNQKQYAISLFQHKENAKKHLQQLEQLQNNKLALTQNITKTEQSLKYANSQQHKLKKDLADNEIGAINKKKHVQQLQKEQQLIEQLLGQQSPKLSLIEKNLNDIQDNLTQSMNAQHICQQQYDEANKQVAQFTAQNVDLENNILNQQRLIRDVKENKQASISLLAKLASEDVSEQLLIFEQKILVEKLSLTENIASEHEIAQGLELVESSLAQAQQSIAKQEGLQQAVQSNLAQLVAINEKKPNWAISQEKWLNEQKIASLGELYQHLDVETPWLSACEQVLSHWLQAVLVNNFPETLSLNTAFFINSAIDGPVQVKPGTLAEKVGNKSLYLPWLNKVYIADNLVQARQLLANLSRDESVICPDTTWLGHHFLRKGMVESDSGLLQRQQNIEALEQQLVDIKCSLTKYNETIQSSQQQARRLKNDSSQCQQNIRQQQEHCQQLEKNIALAQQQQSQIQQQRNSAQQKLTTTKKQLLTAEKMLVELLAEQAILKQGAEQHIDLNILNEERVSIQARIKQLQQTLSDLHRDCHKAAVEVEQTKHRQEKILQSLTQCHDELTTLALQHQTWQDELAVILAPSVSQQKQLQIWLVEIADIDRQLNAIYQEQNIADSEIKQLEQNERHTRSAIEQKKDQINQKKLEAESYRLRAQTVLEQLAEMHKTVEQVLLTLPKEAKESMWQANLVRLAKDINTLGAINLAAIDEYDSQLERKLFLDQQNEDLTQAITTLESAIAKIDKESRYKFKTTFDKVNDDLARLFPKVFGGGSAYLALTGEDLLDTGVTIMARPPGKKNSTIHLLSGGEKALTALSLVFAIFRLNPAPFCMLDEVDAPLDDANVERFCNLVREMSQTVQFIYISHNKIAMEMASHLTGVTMFEPGVSRMVAVDIDEAIAMADIP